MNQHSLLFFDSLNNKIVNIVGPSGSGTSVLFYNIAREALQKNQKIMFISFNQESKQLKELLSNISDKKLSEINDNLILVDAYSQTVGIESKEKYSINSRDLSNVSIGVSKALENNPSTVFFDPFSSIAIHHDEQSLIKTIQIIISKLRNNVNCSYFTFQSGIHSESFYNTINSLADINLVLKFEEQKTEEIRRSINVQSSKGIRLDNKYHQFIIEDNGLIKFVTQIDY